jgi:hypothetical protein
MDLVQFRKVTRTPQLPDGQALVARSVANDHSLLFLFVERAGESAVTETYSSGIGIFPRVKMDVPRRFCLLRVTSGRSQITELPELDVTFPFVDIFPDGRILVVGARCRWRGEDDYDLNGIIFDPRSGQSTRILLGDGISGAHVDSVGRIWVSYTDEGIFGNFGWSYPESTPVGSAGFACFSDSGEKIWEYPQEEAPHAITDCYSLNVSDSGAAIFFYSDFPICRISSDFKLEYWKTNLSGCRQFAISETRVLLSGQYDDATNTAYLGTLEGGQLKDVRKISLLMPDGSSISEGELLGRGSHLYFFNSSDVYRASLE